MALTITINIDDTEEKVLKDNLLDIDQWVQDAVVGKKKQLLEKISIRMDNKTYE